MYDIQKYQRDISVKEYIREYVNVAEFIEYCKECPNYNAVWSCPPYDFEPEDFWNQFSELHIIARKIIFEEGTGPKEGKRIMEEVKAGMREELYDMEKFFPGSVSLSAGSCSMCKGEGCSRPLASPAGARRHEIFYRIHRRQRRTDSKQADGYRVRVGTGG